MKNLRLFLLFISMILSAGIFAQTKGDISSGAIIICSRNLYIATNKTTNLLFPFSIKSVDRGSSDILAQKAPGSENVLQIKAARPNFDQTNLSIITADGQLYSFLVDYSKNPAELNITFDNSPVLSNALFFRQPVHFTDSSMSEKQIKDLTKDVFEMKNNVGGLKDRSYQAVIRIAGIYVENDRMFFKIIMKNHSDIDYEIEQLRFFIRDQKRLKRTASQEIEITPIYSENKPSVIKGGDKLVCVLVLPKFTIPDKKYFSCEMSEKNGGRFLHITIHNKELMKSKVI
jgi:conjugative transposon TraN protein